MTAHIGWIADIHKGPRAYFKGLLRKMGDEAMGLVDDFVHDMNESWSPDVVFNLGDIIQEEGEPHDSRRYGEVFQALSGLSVEMFPVVGNHDLITLQEDDILRFWSELDHMHGLGALEEGRLYYTFRRAGFDFVVLHTRERKDHYIWVDEPQLAWLERTLQTLKGPVVMVSHHALADQDTSGNVWFARAPHLALVRERERIRGMIERAGNVLCAINGHLHWNNLTTHSNIPYITMQSLIENMTGTNDHGVACGAWGRMVLTPSHLDFKICGHDPAHWSLDLPSLPTSQPAPE